MKFVNYDIYSVTFVGIVYGSCFYDYDVLCFLLWLRDVWVGLERDDECFEGFVVVFWGCFVFLAVY
jgi:hypothetical protein